MKLKEIWKKTWYFIWKDDSIWSWIVNIILAFVLIKFIVYPALGFMLGTTHPVVAVVSGSMEHDFGYDDWWDNPSCCIQPGCEQKVSNGYLYDKLGINKQQFSKFPFRSGFNTGDIMFLRSKKNIDIGDVIVFTVPVNPDPIIHRVVKITKTDGKNYYFTKGDHNCQSSRYESNIPEEIIIGKATLRIPFLGWIKIWFVKLVNMVI